jgi:uncharacterized membrane protein
MELRDALLQAAADHRLDPKARARLEALAGLDAQPKPLARVLPLGVAVLAAALIGLALVFWIAANWETLDRFGRFAVLQAAVLVMGIGALTHRALRAPLALVVLMATGGLFAYFGQTYQTGADPWQLFALWAVLALPLALGLRTDVLWAPWALVAMTGVALWVQAYAGHRWRVQPDDLAVHLVGWGAAIALVFALGPAARRFTGAGAWSHRTAATLAVVMITGTALGGLFWRHVAPHYAIGLVVLAVAAAAFAARSSFDVFGLSAVALGLNTLLVAGLGRLLLDGARGDPIGRLLMIGLVAAASLALSVQGILKLSRQRGAAAASGEGGR